MKLTKTAIDKAAYEGREYPGKDGKTKFSRYVLWDDELPGFGLRITPTGVKTFIVSYRVNGRKRLQKVGRYGKMTLDRAKRRARTLLGQAEEGIDPLEEAQLARAKGGEPTTVAQLCDTWLEKHSKRTKKTWAEDERRIEKHIKPNLGRSSVDRLTKGRIDELFLELSEDTPIEANRVIILLGTIYAYAIDKGYLPLGFKNPAKRKKQELNPELARNRVVRTEEMPKLVKAIKEDKNPQYRDLFLLLLLTGLRISELLNAKYSDLDLGAKTLHLPDTKTGKPRTVPLSDEAVSVIKGITRRLGNPYLFPSMAGAPDKPMSAPKKGWQRIKTAAGCPDLRVHDLRRTVSYIVMQEIDPRSAKEALGHADMGTTLRHYANANLEGARNALSSVSKTVLGESA